MQHNGLQGLSVVAFSRTFGQVDGILQPLIPAYPSLWQLLVDDHHTAFFQFLNSPQCRSCLLLLFLAETFGDRLV